MNRIIVAGDAPLSFDKPEVLNLYDEYLGYRKDTAVKVIRESTFEEFCNFLRTNHPTVRIPTKPGIYTHFYEVEGLD